MRELDKMWERELAADDAKRLLELLDAIVLRVEGWDDSAPQGRRMLNAAHMSDQDYLAVGKHFAGNEIRTEIRQALRGGASK